MCVCSFDMLNMTFNRLNRLTFFPPNPKTFDAGSVGST